MLSTPVSFQMITRDMNATLNRTANQPDVKRATEYYRENITKVSSLDEFFADPQLYNYAMKAYGLDDMIYAKAFMRKVLESDLTDPNSFANKMVDTRYQEFAKAFGFAKPVPQSDASFIDIETRYADVSKEEFDFGDALIRLETAAYEQGMDRVTSVDDFLKNDHLVDYALTAFKLDAPGRTDAAEKNFLRQILTSDPSDENSFAARQVNPNWAEFAKAFNFGTEGNVTVQQSATVDQTVQNYLRQTVEVNAGQDNEGVRLALYFERKAPTIQSAYSILADKALMQVVQTTLGLSAESGSADLDVQANYIASKIDIENLAQPEELKKFLTRFTAMWEVAHPTAPQSVPNLLSGQPGQLMSVDTLMSLQGLRLGGN